MRRPSYARCDAGAREQEAVVENRPTYIADLRAERHVDSDLARPLSR